jgi:glucose/mannose transport system permease protein
MVPAMWPIVIAVLVILLQFALKTYELVRALTAGGPGIATTLPTIVVYDYMFQRGLMGAGSAAAVMLLLSLLVIIGPYAIYQRLRARRMSRHG